MTLPRFIGYQVDLVPCTDCEGVKPPECDLCGGEGRTYSRHVDRSGATLTDFDCPACGGSGRVGDACGTCKGRGEVDPNRHNDD